MFLPGLFFLGRALPQTAQTSLRGFQPGTDRHEERFLLTLKVPFSCHSRENGNPVRIKNGCPPARA